MTSAERALEPRAAHAEQRAKVEEAIGRDPLSITDGSSNPSEEEDNSMLDQAGLQVHDPAH